MIKHLNSLTILALVLILTSCSTVLDKPNKASEEKTELNFSDTELKAFIDDFKKLPFEERNQKCLVFINPETGESNAQTLVNQAPTYEQNLPLFDIDNLVNKSYVYDDEIIHDSGYDRIFRDNKSEGEIEVSIEVFNSSNEAQETWKYSSEEYTLIAFPPVNTLFELGDLSFFDGFSITFCRANVFVEVKNVEGMNDIFALAGRIDTYILELIETGEE